MKNEFLIYIKLLPINPETNRTFAAPCEMQPQIAVNLFYYLEKFKRNESHDSDAYKTVIEEILGKIYKAFNVPMGWLIEMQSTDEFFAMDNPFYQPEKRFSKEFFYSPKHGKTEIDVDFMWQWAIEQLNKRYETAN